MLVNDGFVAGGRDLSSERGIGAKHIDGFKNGKVPYLGGLDIFTTWTSIPETTPTLVITVWGQREIIVE